MAATSLSARSCRKACPHPEANGKAPLGRLSTCLEFQRLVQWVKRSVNGCPVEASTPDDVAAPGHGARVNCASGRQGDPPLQYDRRPSTLPSAYPFFS
jgi:hypothetical protein